MTNEAGDDQRPRDIAKATKAQAVQRTEKENKALQE